MTSLKPMLLVVAAALVRTDGRLLLAQRPPGKTLAGLWEFPGGKVEADESPELALVRELREELGLSVQIDDLHPLTFASHAYERFHLIMPVYACRRWQGEATGREGQALEWVAPAEFGRYPMPPADLPLLPRLTAYVETGR